MRQIFHEAFNYTETVTSPYFALIQTHEISSKCRCRRSLWSLRRMLSCAGGFWLIFSKLWWRCPDVQLRKLDYISRSAVTSICLRIVSWHSKLPPPTSLTMRYYVMSATRCEMIFRISMLHLRCFLWGVGEPFRCEAQYSVKLAQLQLLQQLFQYPALNS